MCENEIGGTLLKRDQGDAKLVNEMIEKILIMNQELDMC